jgi:hypothetical protein
LWWQLHIFSFNGIWCVSLIMLWCHTL